ncbi:MAG: hypothetical protein DI629_20900 [Mesorhizobium amorphae]|nr:MAG: hypothetical protein DI629_20900 [Mesorhizobium amorphae]
MRTAGAGLMSDPRTFWHVTPRDNVPGIMAEGLLPGWVDDGLGVYLWSDLAAAEDYLAAGGWDGGCDPSDLEIIEISCDGSEVDRIIPDPGWPNPEDYEHVRLRRAADEDDAWRPGMRVLPEAGEDGPPV